MMAVLALPGQQQCQPGFLRLEFPPMPIAARAAIQQPDTKENIMKNDTYSQALAEVKKSGAWLQKMRERGHTEVIFMAGVGFIRVGDELDDIDQHVIFLDMDVVQQVKGALDYHQSQWG
ncbi:hypothetical protein [Thiomonas sp.]